MENTMVREGSCPEQGREKVVSENGTPIKYSIVAPFYNEEANVCPLYVRIAEVMDSLGAPYEMVFVDDGSRDQTYELLAGLARNDSRICLIQLRRNFGQTAALQAGFDQAQGDVVISLDSDLQHDPAEIPRFIAKIEEGYDLVSGWRSNRVDAWLTRRLPSRIANGIMARLSGVEIHDFGTTFKAYRREILQNIHLYGEHHRFIPALASWSGARIGEIPIKNVARKNGKSNYGLSRTLQVLLDLIGIKFLIDYSTRPLHFFGSLGLVGMGLGAMISSFLLFKKLVLHQGIILQHGTLLFMAVLMILGGALFLSLGLLGEMMTRTYYESQRKTIYALRETSHRGNRAQHTGEAEPKIGFSRAPFLRPPRVNGLDSFGSVKRTIEGHRDVSNHR